MLRCCLPLTAVVVWISCVVQAFDAFDADRSGSISAAELKMICDKLTEGDEGEEMSTEAAAAMIKMVDRNGDGRIDYAEFVQVS